ELTVRSGGGAADGPVGSGRRDRAGGRAGGGIQPQPGGRTRRGGPQRLFPGQRRRGAVGRETHRFRFGWRRGRGRRGGRAETAGGGERAGGADPSTVHPRPQEGTGKAGTPGRRGGGSPGGGPGGRHETGLAGKFFSAVAPGRGRCLPTSGSHRSRSLAWHGT